MQFENLAALKAHVEKPIPPTEWITVTQEMVNAFADATLDKQWIHIDVERAKKESPFGGTIAHGFMSISMASKFLEMAIQVDSVKMVVNYGLNKIRFPHHVAVNARLRMHPSLVEVEAYGDNGAKVTMDIVIEIEGIAKPACVAQFIILLFE